MYERRLRAVGDFVKGLEKQGDGVGGGGENGV
jgi:hypothetical protein